MRMMTRISAAILLIAGAVVAAAQTPVGQLTDLRGQVEVDAFATGEFLSARESERLYRQSVVRLANGAVAWLVIDGQRVPLTAGTSHVSEHLSVRERRERKPLFRALAEILFGAGKESEQQVALGTRASEAGGDDGFGFFDDAQTLEAAEQRLADGEFEEALGEMESLLDPDLTSPGHVHYVYGAAYFGLGNFDAAYRRLGSALDEVESAAEAVPHFLPALLMQLGYAAYLVDDAPLARDAADLLWQLPPEIGDRGHALLLLMQLDIDAGRLTTACSRVSASAGNDQLAAFAEELQALGSAAGCD